MSHENDQSLAERNLRRAADAEGNADWAYARSVACNIGPAKRGPKSSSPQGEKLGMVEAAKIMSKSDNTLRAYLAAWNAAAADGHCTPATDLTPEDDGTADLPAAELWEKYRNPNSHSAKPEPKGIPADPVKAIAQAVPKLTPEQKREMVAEVIASDPQAAPKPTPEQTNEMVRDAILADPVTANVADNALEERTRRAEEKWGPKMAPHLRRHHLHPLHAQWRYKLVSNRADVEPWAKNRITDAESRLDTMTAIMKPIVAATDGRTKDGRIAREMYLTFRQLKERLEFLRETVA